jgi:branched-chain amino acid transport system permease protein
MVVVLGGLGSMSGNIIAAIAWITLLEGLRIILPAEVLDLRMVIYPVVLVAMMILRPQGLMGRAEISVLRPPKVAVAAKKEQDSVNADD